MTVRSAAETGWKLALVEYVNVLNEAGIRGDPRLLGQIPDDDHRIRLGAKVRAVGRRDRECGIRAVRSEMRARIEHSRVFARSAEADIAVHSVRSSEQNGEPWVEERIDRERVTLTRVSGCWKIDSVKPLRSEERYEPFLEGEDPLDTDDAYGEKKAQTPVPYLNPSALYHFKSRVYAGAWAGEAGGWDGTGRVGTPYRREAAAAYAERWWNEPNPAYQEFEVNCTNYVSQCLFAGGAPMNYTGKRDLGWWYKGYVGGQELWSYSWSMSSGLARYLSTPRGYGLRAEIVHDPAQLGLGDVICYDWEGTGRFQHSTIVTAFTPEGMPLVNANTVSSRHRYWDYRDSYAWTENTKYRMFHIADEL